LNVWVCIVIVLSGCCPAVKCPAAASRDSSGDVFQVVRGLRRPDSSSSHCRTRSVTSYGVSERYNPFLTFSRTYRWYWMSASAASPGVSATGLRLPPWQCSGGGAPARWSTPTGCGWDRVGRIGIQDSALRAEYHSPQDLRIFGVRAGAGRNPGGASGLGFCRGSGVLAGIPCRSRRGRCCHSREAPLGSAPGSINAGCLAPAGCRHHDAAGTTATSPRRRPNPLHPLPHHPVIDHRDDHQRQHGGDE
jgi:hypothetical protein